MGHIYSLKNDHRPCEWFAWTFSLAEPAAFAPRATGGPGKCKPMLANVGKFWQIDEEGKKDSNNQKIIEKIVSNGLIKLNETTK